MKKKLYRNIPGAPSVCVERPAAMMIAGSFNIPEVCLLFGNRLLRGNRSVKTDADGFNAFDSPNFPHIGEIGVKINIRWDLVAIHWPSAVSSEGTI
jgi:hypothetical protein